MTKKEFKEKYSKWVDDNIDQVEYWGKPVKSLLDLLEDYLYKKEN